MNLFCGIGLVSVEKYRYRYPKKYRYLPIPIPHLYIQFIRWIIPYGKSRADLIKKSLWQKNSPQNMVCIKRTEIRWMHPTGKLFCIMQTYTVTITVWITHTVTITIYGLHIRLLYRITIRYLCLPLLKSYRVHTLSIIRWNITSSYRIVIYFATIYYFDNLITDKRN